MKGEEITIAEIVRNGTMSAEMAGLLWAAADEGVSFMTVAVPQNAGKSTTADAVLALRPAEVDVIPVADDPELIERLQRERRGGYLSVSEFNPRMRRSYIWDEPARRVFETLTAGYSLQASLHAGSAEDGVREITHGIGVSDERAATLRLILYIEMFGDWRDPDVRRRLVDLYEVRDIKGGEPVGQSLYRWIEDGDRFEQISEPTAFGRDVEDRKRRASIIGELAAAGRTASADVAAAVKEFRSGTRV
jgi:type IV secretory pathway ATPase VirB11/archaellum biosynthesis ATPase